MRSDNPDTVYVLGKDGSRSGMSLSNYLGKYEYDGDGISGVHNQQVRDNRGEISDNPSLQAIANTTSGPTPRAVGGQSAASSHGWRTVQYQTSDPLAQLNTEPGLNSVDPFDYLLIFKGALKLGLNFAAAAIITKLAGKEAVKIAGKDAAEIAGRAAAEAAQPASEQVARAFARQIGKDIGPDARRAFHDMKLRGAGDRSLQQLKEDALFLYEEAGRLLDLPDWMR